MLTECEFDSEVICSWGWKISILYKAHFSSAETTG